MWRAGARPGRGLERPARVTLGNGLESAAGNFGRGRVAGVVGVDGGVGDAPVWTVDIAADFKRWIVRRNRGGLVIPPLPGQGLVKSVRPGRSGMLLVPRGPRLWLPRR